MQNVLEKRELVSGFPSAAVEILLGKNIKAAHSGATSGWKYAKAGAKKFFIFKKSVSFMRESET